MAMEPVVHDLHHPRSIPPSSTHERNVQTHHPQTTSEETRHHTAARSTRQRQVEERNGPQSPSTIPHALHRGTFSPYNTPIPTPKLT